MSWERRVWDLLEDLEQQAAGLAREEREAALAELGAAAYAEVDLASRLHAAVGRDVTLAVAGTGSVQGRLLRAGAGWVLLGSPTDAGPWPETLVTLAAVHAVAGLPPGARPEAVRAITARLGIGSVLRGVALERAEVLAVAPSGEQRRGRLGRVGADFVELVDAARTAHVLPFTGLALLRRGR